MARNDPVPSSLIHDMGRYSGSSPHDASPEQQLMQRAGDPLLVREFLSREPNVKPMPGVAPMPGEATIRLARCILAQGSVEQLNLAQAPKRYVAREPLLESSRTPLAFTPSAKEREGAIELGQPHSTRGSPTEAMAGPAAVIAGLAFATVLLWMLFQLVWI